MNPATVQVRQASLADLAALVPLFDGYRQFYRQESDLARAEVFLRERLERAEAIVFLAWEHTTALGFTLLYPWFSSVSTQRFWILNDLFVVPSERGRGVGALLLQRAQAWARETNAKGLFLETAVDNPAQQLYERLGWRRDPGTLYYTWLTATSSAADFHD